MPTRKLMPSVTKVFRKDQNLFVCLEAYQPGTEQIQMMVASLMFFRGTVKAPGRCLSSYYPSRFLFCTNSPETRPNTVTLSGTPTLCLCVTMLQMTATASPVTVGLAILAVWRITHLLWGEDGPGDIVVRIRRLAGDGFWGRVLDCFYCLSLWVAIPFAVAIGGGWPERVIAWFGLSGGAILLERLTTRETVSPPSSTHHSEKNNVMLR
jgi:hypothetical protein